MTPRLPIVFVVDDDEAVRDSLEALLRSVELQVETFASAEEFLRAFVPEQPGCLVVDVRMQGMSGLELQQTLRDRGIHLPVIIVTGHGDVPVAVKAMKSGAFEFLEKPFSKQLFLEQVQRALDRDRQRRAVDDQWLGVHQKLEQLTPREKEVLDGILAGKISKQIAFDLGISKKTVDVHRGNLMRKMQAGTVAELVEQVISLRAQNDLDGRNAMMAVKFG